MIETVDLKILKLLEFNDYLSRISRRIVTSMTEVKDVKSRSKAGRDASIPLPCLHNPRVVAAIQVEGKNLRIFKRRPLTKTCN